MPDRVHRVGLALTDLKATLDGVELKPGFALGMKNRRGSSVEHVIMDRGDLDPVIAQCLQHWVHLVGDQPEIAADRRFPAPSGFENCISGRKDDAGKLAEGPKAALAQINAANR